MKRLLLFIGLIILFSNIFAKKGLFEVNTEDIYTSVKEVNIDKYLYNARFGVFDPCVHDTIRILALIEVLNDTIATIKMDIFHCKYPRSSHQYSAKLNKITYSTNDSVIPFVLQQINDVRYWYSKASKQKVREVTVDIPYTDKKLMAFVYMIVPK